jgi:hypothetical protein
MRKYIAILVLAGLAISCDRSGNTQYKNYEKWVINDWSTRALNGTPKEVKETLYSELSDTSFQPPPTFSDYRIYRFDAAGNLVYMYSFIDSSYINEIHKSYNLEGMRKRSYAYDKPGGEPVDKSEEISEKMGDNKYRVTSGNKNVMSYDKIETYSDDGDLLGVEYWKNGRQFGSVSYEYKNDRLEYAKKIREKDTIENVYYYSAKGFVDSIAANKRGVRQEVKVYVNNAQGDPVEVREGGYTARLRYEYDSKNNWVKRLVYDPTPSIVKDTSSKFPDYSLFIREIKY